MRISEVADRAGVDISTVRFYERKGLISPKRTGDGAYRSYTEEDLRRLKLIILYRKIDLPIETIRQLLSGQKGMDEALSEQEIRLEAECEKLESSLALCRKILKDQKDPGQNIDEYLNYVKNEEARGMIYPEIIRVLDNIADSAAVRTLAGQGPQGFFARHRWMKKVIGIAVLLVLVVFPVFMVIESAIEVIKGQAPMQRLAFWGVFALIFLLRSVGIVRWARE